MEATSSESGYIPIKCPSVLFLAKLSELTVDIATGKVYNSKGKELGSIDNSPQNGYVQISVYAPDEIGLPKKNRHFKRANIVWWKATGQWPIQPLDHKDRNKLNDAYNNLRPCTHVENMNNRKDNVRIRTYG